MPFFSNVEIQVHQEGMVARQHVGLLDTKKIGNAASHLADPGEARGCSTHSVGINFIC